MAAKKEQPEMLRRKFDGYTQRTNHSRCVCVTATSGYISREPRVPLRRTDDQEHRDISRRPAAWPLPTTAQDTVLQDTGGGVNHLVVTAVL